MKVEYPYDV